MAVQSREMKGSALTCNQFDEACGMPVFTQSSHGFSIGDVVYRSSATAYAGARADDTATISPGLSLVIHVPDTNTHVPMAATTSREVTFSSHGLGSFGQELWLSQATAGLITATEPSSGIIIYLGYVVDANTICWEPGVLY